MTTLRRSPQEIAPLGGTIYETRVRPSLTNDDLGRFVAIDVESEDYEIDEDDYSAIARLRLRKPQAVVWLMRAGYKSAYRIGYAQ